MSTKQRDSWHPYWDRYGAFGANFPIQTVPSLWATAVTSHPDQVSVVYRGRSLSVAELEAQAEALAQGMRSLGIASGDRIAVYLQNQPEFIVALLAAWRLGAIVVPINPMNRERELDLLLQDSGAIALILLDELWPIARTVLDSTLVKHVVLTSASAYSDQPESEPFELPAGALRFAEVLAAHSGQQLAGPLPAAEDIALLVYTSGTTGPAKGAMITHANIAFNTHNWQALLEVMSDDVILGVAPLFHITGMLSAATLALSVPATVVLDFRFDAARTLALIERYSATCVVGATSVFIAMLDSPAFAEHDISSLRKVISGGAPIPPAVLERYEDVCGVYIHPAYGLTETTSVALATPLGSKAPIDKVSGAVAIGVPVPGTACRIVDSDHVDLAPGTPGEVLISGPNVMAGYWGNTVQTELSLRQGWLSTGDIGVANAEGWVFLVDRKKDQINAAGYKVWPREVEDVLYEHPAVREAAVVGVPDPVRGETVKAFVSLRPNTTTTATELIDFARQRMAAYKYPRIVEIVDDLPKTTSGKILRRALRASIVQTNTPRE